MQVLTDPSDFLLWVSAVRPGSTQDMRAACDLVRPALYRTPPEACRG